MLGTRTGSCASECQSKSLETPPPPNSLSPFLSFLFLLSGGSECSGLHVLSRCVGIEENINVKRKGAQKTPRQLCYWCKYLCMIVSREERFICIYRCVAEKRAYLHCTVVWGHFCVYACLYTVQACLFCGCNLHICVHIGC